MEYPFKDLLPLDEVLEREGYYKDWTHLDPKVFYSLTQISEYIKTKGFGVDVRLLIAQLAEHFSLKTSQINEIERFFKDVMQELAEDKDFHSLPEIAGARGGFGTLGERLNSEVFDMSRMGQDVKEAMTGGSVAVVGKNAILEENIVDKQVTAEKTNFAKPYVNLFNGVYTAGSIGGSSADGFNYYTSIAGKVIVLAIEPNVTYTISRSTDTNRFGVATFGSEPTQGSPVKRLINDPSNVIPAITFTADSTDRFLVISLSTSSEFREPAWLQIEKGSGATPFVGYGKLDIDVAIKNDNIVEPIKKENTTVVEKYNLLNKSVFLNDRLLIPSGEVTTYAGFKTTTLQFIKAGQYYVTNHRRLITYNQDGEMIKDYDNSGHLAYWVTIDNDCYYQISCRDEHWENLKVRKKDLGELPDNTLLLADDIFIPQLTGSQRFSNKNIIFFGDSILRNYAENQSIPHLVGERLGCDVTNVAIGGTKIAYVSEDDNTPLSGSRLLEAKINNDLSEQLAIAELREGDHKERMLDSLNSLNSKDLDYYDFGVIAYTTNDFLQSIPEGDFDKDRATIKGAYSYFIENLLTVAPSMKLLLVSPAYQWRPDDLSFDIDEYTNNAGLKMADIVRIIKEVADHYKLEFLDNFNNAGINDFNRHYYYPSNDGVHPLVSTGIPVLANRIASKLEDIF